MDAGATVYGRGDPGKGKPAVKVTARPGIKEDKVAEDETALGKAFDRFLYLVRRNLEETSTPSMDLELEQLWRDKLSFHLRSLLLLSPEEAKNRKCSGRPEEDLSLDQLMSELAARNYFRWAVVLMSVEVLDPYRARELRQLSPFAHDILFPFALSGTFSEAIAGLKKRGWLSSDDLDCPNVCCFVPDHLHGNRGVFWFFIQLKSRYIAGPKNVVIIPQPFCLSQS